MRIKHTLFALTIALSLPTAASAQVCFGVPTTTTAAYAAVGLPDNGTHLHLGGALPLSGALSAGAEFTHTSVKGGGNVNAIDGTLAHTLALGENASPFSICPLATVGYRSIEDEGLLSLGAGAGITAELPLAEGAYTLHPYFVPRIVHMRAYGGSETHFGFAFGANVGFSNYFAGAQYSRVGSGDFFGLSHLMYGTGFRIQAGLSF